MAFLLFIKGCSGNVIPGSESSFTKPVIQKLGTPAIKDSIVKRGLQADYYYTMDEQGGYIRDKDLEAYANRIFDQLHKKAPYIHQKGKIYLLPSKQVNAKVHADGNIFINYGAFKQLNSESAFVALIAHEYAHLLLAHHETDEYIEYQKRAFRVKNKILSLKYALNKSLKSGQISESDYHIKNDILHQVIIFSEGFLAPRWKHYQEYEADMLAYDLLRYTGYQTEGLGQLFEVLEEDEKNHEEEKKKNIEQLIQEKKSFSDKFQLLGSEMIRSLASLIFETHPPADLRKKRISNYQYNAEKFYVKNNINLPSPSSNSIHWKKVKSRPITTKIYEAINYINAAQAAQDEKSMGRLTASAEKVLGGDSSSLSHQPFVRTIRADFRTKQGKIESALFNLKLGKKSPYTPFSMLLKEYELSEPSKARYNNLINDFRNYHSPPYAYRVLIGMARDSGFSKHAEDLLQECRLNFIKQIESCEPDTKSLLESINISNIMKNMGL